MLVVGTRLGMNKQEPAPFVRLVYHEGMYEAHVCMWSEPHMHDLLDCLRYLIGSMYIYHTCTRQLEPGHMHILHAATMQHSLTYTTHITPATTLLKVQILQY